MNAIDRGIYGSTSARIFDHPMMHPAARFIRLVVVLRASEAWRASTNA
jgi:hypothetical protein